MNILGSSIKEVRKSKKLTQKKLAELTGFKQNTISNHENGNRQLDEKDIRIYAQALEVSPQYLFASLGYQYIFFWYTLLYNEISKNKNWRYWTKIDTIMNCLRIILSKLEK